MSKKGHVEPIHPYSQNIPNYNIIVSRVNYTLIQHVSIVIFHTCFTKRNQRHMSAFFSKAGSNERRLPEHSVYLKGDLTTGNAQ